MRWVGSIFVWLSAPLTGVAAVNLPFFAYFYATGHFGQAALPHQAPAIGAAALLLIWLAALGLTARTHVGRARAVHLGVAAALVVAGAAAALLPTLTGPKSAQVQYVI